MPKGTKIKKYARLRQSKEQAREAVRQRITARLAPLVDAQMDNAQGLKYLVTRDRKTGKFIRVGPALAAHSDQETIEVWEKDPSVQAFSDLLNRALDKPAEPKQSMEHSGTIIFKHELD